jgi:hypothetical protein
MTALTRYRGGHEGRPGFVARSPSPEACVGAALVAAQAPTPKPASSSFVSRKP